MTVSAPAPVLMDLGHRPGISAHPAFGLPVLADESRSARPLTIGGRYAVSEVIGRGGAASVYAARDLLLGREVAVKMFTAGAEDPEQLRIQELEAHLLARLDHAALTTIFDAGLDVSGSSGARIYLVMERMHGGDLKRRLTDGALTPSQVADLGSGLSRGLRHVHEHGVLHRDVKPANVLLTARTTDGRVRAKLGDFGIASLIGAVPSDSTMGTGAYLSPEQLGGDEPSPASDIYSLGLVLLESLTGVLEFPGDVEERAAGGPEEDAHVPAGLPFGLAGTLRSMLQRDPDDRAGLTALADEFTSFRSPANGRALEDASADAVDPDPHIHGSVENGTYDRVAHLASRLLDVPVAFVSLVEGDQQHIRSCWGLDLAGTVMDRHDPLCGVPVDTQQPWTVVDLRDEPRLRNNPILIAEPTLRSYAAAPLTTEDGHTIGTLGVFDRRTRDFSDGLTDLGELAAILMREWELRRAVQRALFAGSMG